MSLLLDRFDLLRIIGRGGMATVWRARDSARDEEVAVKLLRGSKARDERWISAFYDEVQAVARLRHPVVVDVFDFGLTPHNEELVQHGIHAGTPYYVMEVIDGPPLADVDPQDWATTRDLLMHLLDGLAHIHARGVIHRDLKPSNVLYDTERKLPRIADFGIAVFEDDLAEDETVVIGTPAYMAPEQIRGERWKYGPWTDLYALGAMAFWMVCGFRPFEGANDEVIRAHLSGDRSDYAPCFEVPPGLERWIDRLLATRIVDRFRSAPSAAHALLELAGPRGTTGHRLATRPVSEHLTTLRFDRSSATPLPASWEPPTDRLAQFSAGLGVFAVRRPPMVGRRTERSRLWTALTQTAETRQPRCVVLRGNTGCGTSFLAEWTGERAAESADVVMLSFSDDGSVDPIRQAVLRRLRCQADDPDTLSRLRDWHELWGGVGPAELWACMQLTSAQTVEDTHRAARQILARMLGEDIGYLWFDDIQRSAAMLEFVTTALDQHDLPALLVCTVDTGDTIDPELAEALEEHYRRDDVDVIDVEPLPEADLGVLIDALIDLDPKLRADIIERAGGHALFAVQLIGDWVERGELEFGSGGTLRLTQDAQIDLPDTLHALWRRRVDDVVARNPAPGWHALEIAAALGMYIERDDWLAALELARIDVDRWFIDRLFARGLFEPSRGGWRFAHGMLRESLVRHAKEAGRWEECNLVCARIFASSTTYPARLRHAEHLVAADHEDAAAAMLRAGREASAEGRYRAAVAALRRVEELGITGLRAEQRAELAYALSQLHELTEAEQMARDGVAAARRTGNEAFLAGAFASLGAALRPRDARRALDAYEEAAALFRELGDIGREARALVSAAWCHLAEGQPERGIELLEYAGALNQQAGVDDTRVGYSLANMHAELGAWAAADEAVREVRAMSDNPYIAAICDTVDARTALGRGQLAEAQRRLDAAAEWDMTTGQWNPERALLTALAHTEAGEFVAARALFEEVVDRIQSADAFAVRARALAGLMRLAVRVDDRASYDDARLRLEAERDSRRLALLALVADAERAAVERGW